MARRAAPQRDETVGVAMDALRRIVQILRASAGAAQHDFGLTGAQLFVLEVLGSAPGMSVGDLAARTFTHQSSVSLVVRRLVQRGLVVKAGARDDGRRVELRVTNAGRAIVRRAPHVAQRRLLEGIVQLPPRDRRRLADALGSIAAHMGRDHSLVPMMFERRTRRARSGRSR
jgi:MarR family transcriptional regulator, lower aerobic nicotinate degradation pathway regulator